MSKPNSELEGYFYIIICHTQEMMASTVVCPYHFEIASEDRHQMSH